MQLGRSLAFGARGAILAVASPDGLRLVDATERRAPVHHAIERIADMTAVGDELWVATERPRLVRFDATGAICGERALWGSRGTLRATAIGVPNALWTVPPIALVGGAASGTSSLATTEVDCVVPVSSTRWITCRRERVQLRDPGTERWAINLPSGTRVADGAVLFGGSTVALVLTANDALAQLVVLGLHDGATHHRITLRGVDLVRFAAARGYALLRASADALVLVDLRFGTVLREHRAGGEILDAAIDDAGQAFAMRFGEEHDAIELCSIQALLATPTAVAAAPIESDEPEATAEPEPPPAPVEERAAFHRGELTLSAAPPFAPRLPQPAATPTDALAMLERYRGLLSAIAGHAIARAWDQGRLSLPAESGLPFHAEVAGLLGDGRGRARKELGDAEARVTTALAAVSKLEQTFATPTPLSALSAELGLSPTAQLVLLVIAAPALWGDLARLYGILANDVARAVVDEQLVTQLLAPHASTLAVARELDRDAPLVRHGLVYMGAGKMRPFLALTIDPVVRRLLRADDTSSELRDVRVIAQPRAFDDLLIPARVKDDLVRRVAEVPRSETGRVVVHGRSGTGRHAVLAALAAAAGRRLAVIDATQMMRDAAHRADELAVILRRVHLVGYVPCIDGLEAMPSNDPAVRDLVRQILDEHPGPLALRVPADLTPPLSPGYVRIDLPPLSMEQRTATWQHLLAEHDLQVRDPGELADRYRVGPATIASACAHVASAMTPGDGGEASDASLALETAIRQHLDTKLRETATHVERLASWSRVILPPDIQESVLELIARIKHRRTVYDHWGMGDVLTTARGVTALFQGGPGTGKTLVASAIANELGMDLYRIDLSRIMSKWIGETEQNLAKLFDAAEEGHTILLFDEADSLFSKRTEVKSSVDRYANLEVNYLLQRLDTFEGIAILTTNFGTAIDNAFKRRLSFRLTFPFPDEDAREQLWRAHLPAALPKSGAFDFIGLARRYRLSGGYIRNATLRAAFLAAEEHVPLTQDHLERAIKAEFREIGKIAESGVLE